MRIVDIIETSKANGFDLDLDGTREEQYKAMVHMMVLSASLNWCEATAHLSGLHGENLDDPKAGVMLVTTSLVFVMKAMGYVTDDNAEDTVTLTLDEIDAFVQMIFDDPDALMLPKWLPWTRDQLFAASKELTGEVAA